MKKKTVIGFYSHHGYEIIVLENSDTVYSASNHRFDSTQSSSIGSPNCLSLREIRGFCIKTGKEIAKEKGWIWEGATRIEE